MTTSPKGSYKTEDILAFLERHLPSRQLPPWRIIMADDHKPHGSPCVRRLCWERGYVFIPHGGGAAPVVQTVVTDLNQHVKREYKVAERAAFCEQMRRGRVVPQLLPERRMDLMAPILENMRLHHEAARGYIKTGMRAPLDDSSLDHEINREAGAARGIQVANLRRASKFQRRKVRG